MAGSRYLILLRELYNSQPERYWTTGRLIKKYEERFGKGISKNSTCINLNSLLKGKDVFMIEGMTDDCPPPQNLWMFNPFKVVS